MEIMKKAHLLFIYALELAKKSSSFKTNEADRDEMEKRLLFFIQKEYSDVIGK